MRNLESRVKQLEADSKEETLMIVTYYDGETKEQSMERYFEQYPHMREYNGPIPFIFLESFRGEEHA
ncbi:MAG: hypothetical protein AAGU21_14220 [Solidesulfovibrio sp.]|uniref:hypothetical protein n=1 Tax=Solidesulfovibrio sp. TaxID=2910990 RepID=UPI002B202EDD|nr:hypothetical protein [Solidesulfovibrio sp.]MEA4856111.1 hypothetical protein [Solidesulfovibrio sp.]